MKKLLFVFIIVMFVGCDGQQNNEYFHLGDTVQHRETGNKGIITYICDNRCVVKPSLSTQEEYNNYGYYELQLVERYNSPKLKSEADVK